MEAKSSSDIIGFIFVVIGVLVGTHTVLVSIFRYSLFTIFIKLIPQTVNGFRGDSPSSTWVEIQSQNKQPQEMWISLLLFPLLVVVLFLMAGCWVFLALKLTSVINLNTSVLVTWFLFNAIAFFISACNQAALFVMFKDHRVKRKETIVYRMSQKPLKTILMVFGHFFTNWIRGPIVTLTEVIIVLLVILLYWPFWIIHFILRKSFDLGQDKSRNSYFVIYTAILALLGLSFNFF
jgi:hypothetical protein